MTALSVVQAVATKVGINPVPTSVFGGTDRTSIEMRETLQESARQIAEEFDWGVLRKVATITGDGVLTAFPLATYVPDMDRLIKDPLMVQDGGALGYGYTYVHDFNAIVQDQANPNGQVGMSGYWSLYGGAVNIVSGFGNQPLAGGSSVKFGYVSRNIVVSAAFTAKPAFTADDDTFPLNERLLKLSMIWNWKKSHGQAYAAEMDEYQNALEVRRIADVVPTTISSNRRSPYGTLRFQ